MARYYPSIVPKMWGMEAAVQSVSHFPGGIPSHVAPRHPAPSMKVGDWVMQFPHGAALSSPDLVVCCVVGDGEAETGPLFQLALQQNSSSPIAMVPSCPSCI